MRNHSKIKFSKIVPLVVLALLAVLMLATFSACGLFANLQTISSATIEVEGLQTDGTSYVAQLGESFSLKAKWNNTFVSSPQIQWCLQIDDGQKQELQGATSKTLNYTITNDQTYKFSVIVATVESEQIVVCAQYATLNGVQLSSSSHQIAQGVIQQDLNGTVEDVELTASWNSEYINPDVAVEVEWWVDDQKQANSENTFTYEVSEISSQRSVEVKVVVTQGDVTKSASVTLSFILQYAMVDSVSVEIGSISAQPTATKIADSVYLLLVDNPTQSASVSCDTSVAPQNTNLSSACTWEIETSSSTQTGDDTSRTIERTLSYGKNVICATVDNVKSQRVSVYVLTETDYNSKKTYIDDRFLWYGDSYDHYLSSQSDLSALVGYTVSLHKVCSSSSSDGAQKIYIANPNWKSGNETTEAFKEAIHLANEYGVDESGKFPFSFSVEVFYLSAEDSYGNPAVLGEPSGACETSYTPTQANNYVRYSEVSQKRTSLPIDQKPSVEVRDSNDLFRNVASGYQPIFALDEEGEALAALYQKARDVLLTYIDEDMSELDKVKVIYDWIVNEVEYDYQAAQSDLSDDSVYCYNAFYLEGVFNDKCAVCDGKSKAFALLCGMEGIRVMRITGEVSASGHAWNKVLVDADGDGVREWYVVDTTWGDISTGSTNCTEYLTYEYFLTTDEYIASTHTTNQPQPVATTSYNAYANEKVVVAGSEYTFDVTSKTQLDYLLLYSKQNDGVMLMVRIASTVSLKVSGKLITIDEDERLYMIYYDTSFGI